MNLSKTTQSAVLTVVAVSAVTWTLLAQANPTTPNWGTPINGLQISLSIGTSVALPSHAPSVVFGMRNEGADDLFVLLGAGCGKVRVDTSNLDLILTDSSGTSKRLYYYDGSRSPGCAGAMTSFTVPLPPMASFSTPIRLDYYKFFSSDKNGALEPGTLPVGTYTLQAEFRRGGVATGHGEGIGAVTSNQLRIKFPAP